MYITTFKVSGVFVFPLDMLRYDSCYPRAQEDVSNIKVEYTKENGRQLQVVTLCRMHQERDWKPTFGRWESFGFKVEYTNTIKV